MSSLLHLSCFILLPHVHLKSWPVFHSYLVLFRTVLPFSSPPSSFSCPPSFFCLPHLSSFLFTSFVYLTSTSSPSAGILEQSMGARNRVGIGLSYHPPCYIGWRNRSFESIPGLLKSLKIPSLPSSPVLYYFMSISSLLSRSSSSFSIFFHIHPVSSCFLCSSFSFPVSTSFCFPMHPGLPPYIYVSFRLSFCRLLFAPVSATTVLSPYL